MERKKFISNLAIGGSILLAAPVLFNSCSEDEMTVPEENDSANNIAELDLSLSKYNDLNTVGGFVYEGNIIVIRSTDSLYIALSKICTHQGCEVGYNHAANKLPCPCHGSEFDRDGNVLQGPATSKLTKYTTKLDGDILKIT